MSEHDLFELTRLPFDPPEKRAAKVKNAIDESKKALSGLWGIEADSDKNSRIRDQLKFLEDIESDIFESDGKKLTSKYEELAKIRKEQEIKTFRAAIAIIARMGRKTVTTGAIKKCRRDGMRLDVKTIEQAYIAEGFTIQETKKIPKPDFPHRAEDIYNQLKIIREFSRYSELYKKGPNNTVPVDHKGVVDLYAFAAYVKDEPENVEAYRSQLTDELYKVFEEKGIHYAMRQESDRDPLGNLLKDLCTMGRLIFKSDTERTRYNKHLLYKSPNMMQLFDDIQKIKKVQPDLLQDPRFADDAIMQIASVFGNADEALNLYNHEAGLWHKPYEPVMPVLFKSAEIIERLPCSCGLAAKDVHGNIVIENLLFYEDESPSEVAITFEVPACCTEQHIPAIINFQIFENILKRGESLPIIKDRHGNDVYVAPELLIKEIGTIGVELPARTPRGSFIELCICSSVSGLKFAAKNLNNNHVVEAHISSKHVKLSKEILRTNMEKAIIYDCYLRTMRQLSIGQKDKEVQSINFSRKPVFGIHVGTTRSTIAYINKDGVPEVIENFADGKPTLTSAVYFSDSGKIIVGDEAMNYMEVEPDRTVAFFKRLIGKPEPLICDIDGMGYDPIMLTSLVIKRMKEYAEEQGHEVKDVVMTYPLYYGTAERNAIVQAAQIAGLNVLSCVDESTAITFNYFNREYMKSQRILIYDLGGRSFDIALFDYRVGEDGNGRIDFIRSAGDDMLGGADWDTRLVDYIVDLYCDENGVCYNDIINDIDFRQRVYSAAENIKISLTGLITRSFAISYYGDNTRIVVTREKFEEITSDLVERTINCVQALLSQANVSVDEIDVVLLAGGSSKMPMVKNAVNAMFPDKMRVEDPDLAVVKGAAIAAMYYVANSGDPRHIFKQKHDDTAKKTTNDFDW